MALVEFKDPNNGIEISYSIADILHKRWVNLKEKVLKSNSDRVYVVTGHERSGKSTWAFQQAKFIDPYFDVSRICFSPEDFLEALRNTPPGGVVVFDEAFRGFSSKSAQSKVNKLLVQAMMEVGRRNLIIFIVLPSFTLLENYIANHRSNALFYIHRKESNNYRSWRAYSRKKKSMIYALTKKNYGNMPYVHTKIKGKFWAKKTSVGNKEEYGPYQSFDNDAYENKKDEAFQEKTKEEQKPKEYFDLIILKKKLGGLKFPIETKKEFAEKMGHDPKTFWRWQNTEIPENGPEGAGII